MEDVTSLTTSLCSLRPPVLGPALPPGFRRAAYEHEDDGDGEDGEDFPGPALPPGYQAESSSSEEEDEDVIGPMPSKGPIESNVALEFERRAQRMKDKLTGDVSPHFPHSFICLLVDLTAEKHNTQKYGARMSCSFLCLLTFSSSAA